VLFVHQSAEMYGSDKVLLYLVRALLQRDEFKPVVILPELGPLYDALIADGIEVHIGEVAKISRSTMSPAGLWRLIGQITKGISDIDRIVAGRNIAVVHSNTLAVLSGAIWAARRRVKHLWHVHEIILSPKLISKAFPLLVRLLSDKVMSNSSLTERWLLEEQPKLKAISVVVFNGLPPVNSPSSEEINEFRSSIGAAPNDIVITLAGRINRWKGQGLLVEAATLLKHRGLTTKLRFVIVGSPPPGLENLQTELIHNVAVAGLSDKFSFIPFVNDIWPVWFGSDIGVVPSTEPEPFGMVAIEAMAAGIPVIAAGHGGLLDIVVNNETGMLFEPKNATSLADAIARLVLNVDLRKQMGVAGNNRQHAIFSLESQRIETERIYREIEKIRG
jgi:glycosyltransferase involved in cell wall biosynthesis